MGKQRKFWWASAVVAVVLVTGLGFGLSRGGVEAEAGSMASVQEQVLLLVSGQEGHPRTPMELQVYQDALREVRRVRSEAQEAALRAEEEASEVLMATVDTALAHD